MVPVLHIYNCHQQLRIDIQGYEMEVEMERRKENVELSGGEGGRVHRIRT